MIRNVVTLVGFLLLMAGAYFEIAPDWDYGVTVLMVSVTYFTARESARVVWEHDWGALWYPIFWTWFAADGIYAIYWFMMNRETLLLMRDANWPVSVCLYWMCGMAYLLDKPKTLSDAPVTTDNLVD